MIYRDFIIKRIKNMYVVITIDDYDQNQIYARCSDLEEAKNIVDKYHMFYSQL